MKKALRILVLEDDPTDLLLINHALTRGGLSCDTTRVETKDDFLRELENEPVDMILSDHGVPEFDGFAALAIAREQYPDLPFIFVTGAMGEETTIATFECGATDYVLKNHLDNLAHAVRRALREAEERAKRREAEVDRERLIQALKDALAKVKALHGLLPICSSCKKIRDDHGYWNQLETYLQEHSDATFTHSFCPDCIGKLYPGVMESGEANQG
jgi:DNA-binding NtrC family response regulator